MNFRKPEMSPKNIIDIFDNFTQMFIEINGKAFCDKNQSDKINSKKFRVNILKSN